MIKELKPVWSKQKSFYGKAMVEEDENFFTTLYSYGVPIVRIGGNYVTALWEGWSAATGRHINDFLWQELGVTCNKKQFETLQYWGAFQIDDFKKIDKKGKYNI